MNALVNDNVAANDAIPEEVPNAQFQGGNIGAWRVENAGGVKICRAARNLAQCSGVNAPDEFDVGRNAAKLESDVEAESILDLLSGAHDPLAAGHIHRHGLLTVNMLARL